MDTDTNIPFLEKDKTGDGAIDSRPLSEKGNKVGDAEGLRPQQKRRRFMKLSTFLVIILPTLLSIVYYGLIASDRYAVEVRFAVRGINSTGGNDLLGMVTGIPSSGSTVADSYILMDYIHSREILKKLQGMMNLEKIYGRENADYLSSFDTTEPIEEFVKYWKKMTTISFDSSSQVVSVETMAFTPKHAHKVANAVLNLSEELVNALSAKARKDAVGHAEIEVARMEKRLRITRKAVRIFREKELVIDPGKETESRLSLVAKLEGELGILRAKISALSQFMSKDSPRIVVLTGKIKALETQVLAERSRLGAGGKKGGVPVLLEDYQILLMDKEFAEKAYITALSSLEKARIEAGRQQRYLATFVHPSLPEEALYPKRFLNVLIIFIISLVFWAIGTLIVYAIRDHAT